MENVTIAFMKIKVYILTPTFISDAYDFGGI